jgi:hypothetical protein
MRQAKYWFSALAVVGAALAGGGQALAATTDFATACAQSGVVKCVSFDTDADFSHGSGGTQGAWGTRAGVNPPYGTSDYSRATRDTANAASGASSLRFTIPSNTGSDSSGSWFTNFSDDLSFQVSEGQEVFIQWRQRFSPEFLDTRYTATGGGLANGWKLADVSAGDLATCTPGAGSAHCPTSCWDFETVVQNTDQHTLPQVYANCSGPAAYKPLSGYTSNVTVQNVVGCLYPTYGSPPCVKFFPNEWMTFQIHIKVGNWDRWNSTIQLWVGREGQPSQLVIDCSPTAVNKCSNGVDGAAAGGWYLHNSDPTYKIGKVWLLPYHTNKDPAQATPVAYTWYDNLIISRTKIADPTSGPRPNPPTNVNAQ